MKAVQSKITSTVKNQSLINLINSLIDWLFECSEYLVSNKKTILNIITSRFSSNTDKTVKLISTLNNQINLVSISERIERYCKISDALINIQKFSQLDKYLNEKVRYAKQ